MRPPLTERQSAIYEFIASFLREHRKPPTLQEIADAVGLASTNGVSKHLDALEAKGYIKREPHQARSIRLVDQEDAFALDKDDVPKIVVISRTSSKEPNRLRNRPEGHFVVDPYFLRRIYGNPDDRCLLGRAGDDGMNGDGIRKGDFLLIEEMPWEDMERTELVACLVGEMLLARRFEYANGRFHLRPADRTYKEDVFAPDNPGCYIVGRVIGVMRRLV